MVLRTYVFRNTLGNKDKNNKCVSCKKKLENGEKVSTKRSGNKLRIRCYDCSKKYHLIE
jgi:DNA-directed RNA polymerase subunit RPC12/RpoP